MFNGQSPMNLSLSGGLGQIGHQSSLALSPAHSPSFYERLQGQETAGDRGGSFGSSSSPPPQSQSFSYSSGGGGLGLASNNFLNTTTTHPNYQRGSSSIGGGGGYGGVNNNNSSRNSFGSPTSPTSGGGGGLGTGTFNSSFSSPLQYGQSSLQWNHYHPPEYSVGVGGHPGGGHSMMSMSTSSFGFGGGGRRAEDSEPMNTSPVAHHSPSSAFYLPSFLTGVGDVSSGSPTGSGSPGPYGTRGFGTSTGIANGNKDIFEVSPKKKVGFDSLVVYEKPIEASTGKAEGTTKSKNGGPPISGFGGDGPLISALDYERNLESQPVTGFSPKNTSPSGASGYGPPPYPTTWVTVFGFPNAAASYILTYFGQLGTILESRTNPGSNWIHLRYSNTIEARRALNKNGTLVGGTMMVGVVPWEPDPDPAQSHQRSPSSPNASTLKSRSSSFRLSSDSSKTNNSFPRSNSSFLNATNGQGSSLNSNISSDFKTKLRPLTNSNEESPTTPANPRAKGNGIIGKIWQSMFGM